MTFYLDEAYHGWQWLRHTPGPQSSLLAFAEKCSHHHKWHLHPPCDVQPPSALNTSPLSLSCTLCLLSRLVSTTLTCLDAPRWFIISFCSTCWLGIIFPSQLLISCGIEFIYSKSLRKNHSGCRIFHTIFISAGFWGFGVLGFWVSVHHGNMAMEWDAWVLKSRQM